MREWQIPRECKMPDLSALDPLLGRLLVQLLVGEPGVGRKVGLYRRNFVRLVDKAIREYQQAREPLLAQIAEMKRPAKDKIKNGRHIYFLEFTDYIETCLNALRRLYGLLDRIKSDKESPEVPRELRRLVEAMGESVVDIRDTVEHIDERIQKDEIAPGEPVMLTTNKTSDGVVISKYEIKFEELAMVLRKMHELALYILTIKKLSRNNAGKNIPTNPQDVTTAHVVPPSHS